MNVLFIHQNFPGQFKHLAAALADNPVNEVVALHMRAEDPQLPRVRFIKTQVQRGTSKNSHPWAAETETKIIRGEATWRSAQQLKQSGFTPDVIIAHPGWGEVLFLRDLWPAAKLLCYFEFYYHPSGRDVDFDPEFPSSDEIVCQLRLKNFSNLLALEACDAGLSPTRWQQSTHPAGFRNKIEVVHDGIDTAAVKPDASMSITLPNGMKLTQSDEIITFVNRHLEPYRGFHTFMRSLPEILATRPRAQVFIVGTESNNSYGVKDVASWKAKYLKELDDQLDLSRVHFLGKVAYPAFIAILQVSSVHVYLTYPFVLSWSMLEAMSAGCLVVASHTAPVTEVIEDDGNGLLVDFFSPAEIANAVNKVLDHPTRMQHLRDAARQTIIDRYDLKTICLPRQLELIERLSRS